MISSRITDITDFTDRARWLAQLLGMAERKNYRAGWAAIAYRDRFGCAPPEPAPAPVMPGPEVQRWARNRGARWAKMRLAAAASPRCSKMADGARPGRNEMQAGPARSRCAPAREASEKLCLRNICAARRGPPVGDGPGFQTPPAGGASETLEGCSFGTGARVKNH